MITVKNLTKRYGSKCAVNDISFEVNEGEILGFLGPNGAGKSTTMNILTGYLSSNEGAVTIDGHSVLEDPKAAKACIGYLPEQPPLYQDMTVKEYLNFVYDLKRCTLSRAKHLEEICELVRISDHYNRIIKNLSKGYKQRVGLAQALVGNPKVLILDEPTVGLDPKQIIEIRNLIRGLGRNHTIILSSHILPEVQAICGRVVVISDGRIVADGTPETLSRSLSHGGRLQIQICGPAYEILREIKALENVKFADLLVEKKDGSSDFVIDVAEGHDVRKDLFFMLAQKGWPIYSMRTRDMSLEDIFLSLTKSAEGGAE